MPGSIICTTLGVALLAGAGIAIAQEQRLTALAGVEPGVWQLHEIGDARASHAICIRDLRALVQLRHPGASCDQLVISDGARSATVNYTCRGQGHGRTTITVEDTTLIRLQTQGLSGGAPFDSDYEARRVGSCRTGS